MWFLRQIFAKVPGVFVYDMDGSGNQVNISTRGLDPHRGWEFNIRRNEAITNSVKYAFPNQREGMITISIRKTTEDAIQFSVADDGIGLPEGLEVTKTRSLGLKLMKGLSEDIVAKFYIENRQGTRITIEFNIEKSSQHLQNISSSGNN